MKTLVVGGTGGIGAYIALRLRDERGHEVTVASRNPPASTSPVAKFPFIAGNYVEDDFSPDQLKGFDNVVFTACNDVRQAPRGSGVDAENAFYQRANSEAVPRFFGLAKEAGIRKGVYIGSFYPQAKPDLVGERGYIRSRLDADEGARSFADESFRVISLNAPFVVGALPGIGSGFYAYIAKWASGNMPQVPLTCPPGGTNFISHRSLSTAAMAALEKGENGRGYLVGDENLHFKDMFELFFKALGRGDIELEALDQEHGLLTDRALFAGRAGTIFYEPEGVAELGYERNDIARAVDEILAVERAAGTLTPTTA